MGRNLVETVMGAVVLLIAGFFLVFAYDRADVRPVEGYPLSARFYAIDGLESGGDVRLGGVKIGSVVDTVLDPESFEAVVSISILSSIRLPADSVAGITGEGLLGGKYIEIRPGTDPVRLEPGGEIANTEDVVAIEELLSRAIFLLTDEIDE